MTRLPQGKQCMCLEKSMHGKWRCAAALALALGAAALGACGRTERPSFERYVQAFDPGRFANGGGFVTIDENIPVLPEDVFADATRLRAADRDFFDFLCAYYLSKIDLYFLRRFRTTYSIVSSPARLILEWQGEASSNGCYFVYSNFRIATGVLGRKLVGDSHDWRPSEATRYLADRYLRIRSEPPPARQLALLAKWREEFEDAASAARRVLQSLGYGDHLPVEVPARLESPEGR